VFIGVVQYSRIWYWENFKDSSDRSMLLVSIYAGGCQVPQCYLEVIYVEFLCIQ